MDSTAPSKANKATTHHLEGTPKKPKNPLPENWVILEARENQTVNANDPQHAANTETEAIMRYIELLERTQTQLQKTERIMDKLSGQLGSAIAVTEEQVKGRKPLQEKRDGGNAQALGGRGLEMEYGGE